MAQINVDTSDLDSFVKLCETAGNRLLKEQLGQSLDGIGVDFLRIIEQEIIKRGAVDTRLLLHSFSVGADGNIWTLDEGNLTLEVGTNVEYAAPVNYGHNQSKRFVPGRWEGKRFVYDPSAKSGMMLTAKFVQGYHFWEAGLRAIEKIFPKSIEAKTNTWLNSYFGGGK